MNRRSIIGGRKFPAPEIDQGNAAGRPANPKEAPPERPSETPSDWRRGKIREDAAARRGNLRERARETLYPAILFALVYEFLARPICRSLWPGGEFPSLLDSDIARSLLAFLGI